MMASKHKIPSIFSTMIKLVLFSFFFAFLSCKKPIQIEGFDSEKWHKNPMVNPEQCLNYREQNYQKIIDNSQQLIGKEDQELLQFLGKEDKESLSGRLKKSKAYCLKGCEICDSNFQFAKYLVIDFETFKRIKGVRIAIEKRK